MEINIICAPLCVIEFDGAPTKWSSSKYDASATRNRSKHHIHGKDSRTGPLEKFTAIL